MARCDAGRIVGLALLYAQALLLRAAPLAAQPRAEPACSLPERPQPVQPRHFPPPRVSVDHPANPRAAALGERLFFDARLSSTGEVSCASCHDPKHAFSVPEALPTRGVTHRRLKRHPPALMNLAWVDKGLFWDGGSKNLESLSLAPLTHQDEMGRSLELQSLLDVLARDSTYAACFAAAFPEGLTLGHVLEALAQYERSLVAANARWDRSQSAEVRLTASERRGEHVYTEQCARCHPAPLFTDHDFHNNGLDRSFPDDLMAVERGHARISLQANDLGKFKTPSLRNLSRSAPYMHDGRFRSLRQVIQHYRTGMRDSATLDEGFRAPEKLGVSMSDEEAHDLERFLHTLDE